MPELPEVEHLRRTLAPRLRGRRVTAVRLRRADICTPGADGRSLLLGAVLRTPRRRGKQLVLGAADGRVLRVQLGMTGRLVVAPRGASLPRDHVHALWTLDNGARLVFSDARRFGRLSVFDDDAALRRAWDALGPDALTADAAALGRALARTRRAAKAALLDQGLIAGVGNIYADEALFAARIHPADRADRLGTPAVARLARAIRRVLAAAIRGGGSTVRDYVDGNGDAGGAQRAHRVYGRAGRPCVRCGRALELTRIAGRSTVFCAGCQPRRSRRAP